MDAIHVVGAGGIGCAVGYALRAAGVPVVFVDANPAKVETGRRTGVRVGRYPPLAAEFVHFADWHPDLTALVVLTTKCYDNAAVLARLSPGARLLPIQNGFDPELDAFGHTAEGIASFVSECAPHRPHTHITRPGELHIGGRPTRPTPLPAGRGVGRVDLPDRPQETYLLAAFEKIRTAPGFRVRRVPDISPIKHTKLMYNAAISPLAAAAGIDNGKLLSVPEARALFFGLLQENHAILRAAGIELGTVGPFHPRTVAWILQRTWLSGLMAKFFEPSLRGTYCSMAGEIQKGRTEIANYNGQLIRLAEHAGTPCPLNRAVFDLVVRMTAVREQPHRGVFARLARGTRSAEQFDHADSVA